MTTTAIGMRLNSVPLRELCEVIPGRHIVEEDHNRQKRGVPYLTGPSDFGLRQAIASRWTEKPDVMCAPNDVLVTVKGAGVAKVNFAPAEAACIGRQLMAVRARPGKTTPDFVFVALRWAQEQLKSQASGATVPGLSIEDLEELQLPNPPAEKHAAIASSLRDQLAEVERARAAVEEQLKAAEALVNAFLRDSLTTATERSISECLREVTAGIGEAWAKYPVLGATRGGVAPAKEPVGKSPQRYKPVRPGTIFYNPMRILLGSIAMIDEGEAAGITSPDYVVMTGIENVLHPRWFYYWFRSKYGAEFIKSLSRGAVRERLLFKRLAPAKIRVPDWNSQVIFAERLSAIRALRIALRSKLDSIEAIPNRLLREAFSGHI